MPNYTTGKKARSPGRRDYYDYDSDLDQVPEKYRDLVEDIVEKRVADQVDAALAELDPDFKKKLKRGGSPDPYYRRGYGYPYGGYGHPYGRGYGYGRYGGYGYGHPYGYGGYGHPYGRGYFDYDPYYRPSTGKKKDTWNPYTKKNSTINEKIRAREELDAYKKYATDF